MGSICFEEKLFWTFLVRKGIVLFDLGKNRADEKDGGGGEGEKQSLIPSPPTASCSWSNLNFARLVTNFMPSSLRAEELKILKTSESLLLTLALSYT